jgi:hypothetical protein
MTVRRVGVVVSGVALIGSGLLVPQAAQARPDPAVLAAASAQAAVAQSGVRPARPAPVSLLGGPGVWTKISSGKSFASDEPGLLRTSDGKLHVVWVKTNADNDYSLGYSTISRVGALLNTGVTSPVTHWFALQGTPRLVPDGKNIRLVFNGRQNTNFGNLLGLGARYTETSTNGTAWALVNGSLSSNTSFDQKLTATTKADGTPVSAEGKGRALFYHVGVDPATPAGTSDSETDSQPGSSFLNPALVRDKDGSISVAWFQDFGASPGYYVQKLLPAKGPVTKAPSSGSATGPQNEPRQQVAFTARTGGGVYLAYCQPSKAQSCAHIAVWKVGTKTVRVVPGSTGGHAGDVTISAAPGGRLVVAWYDAAKRIIQVVRSNTQVTAFSAIRVVKLPSKAQQIDNLFSESSTGRIDLVANVQQTGAGNPIAFFHTQVLAALKVTASPTKFAHTKTTTVTFHVTDAGQAVSGVTVKFLGHSAKTNAKGVATIKIAKGQTKATRAATASKADYAPGSVKVKIT